MVAVPVVKRVVTLSALPVAGNKKILCQKCKGKVSIYVERQVYLETHCAPLIKIEFEKAEDSFNVPPP